MRLPVEREGGSKNLMPLELPEKQDIAADLTKSKARERTAYYRENFITEKTDTQVFLKTFEI